VQHYKVTPEPVDSYPLKNTKHNLHSQDASKYATTTNTSAIIKCQECQLHQIPHLTKATLRAHQNFRSPPICLFKQDIDVVRTLPIKSHQIYKDIILLKHHLIDILPQYDPSTNHFHLQFSLNSRNLPAQDPIDNYLDSFLDRPSLIHLNIDLIDQYIDEPVLSLQLKALANSLKQYTDLLFYTDGSLQKDPTFIDSMGLTWICANNEDLTFSVSAIL